MSEPIDILVLGLFLCVGAVMVAGVVLGVAYWPMDGDPGRAPNVEDVE